MGIEIWSPLRPFVRIFSWSSFAHIHLQDVPSPSVTNGPKFTTLPKAVTILQSDCTASSSPRILEMYHEAYLGIETQRRKKQPGTVQRIGWVRRFASVGLTSELRLEV